MAYPFLRQDNFLEPLLNGVGIFKRKPWFASDPKGRRPPRPARFETIEPRILLSADLLPGAADAAEDGMDLLADRVAEFLEGEDLLDQRIPLLLSDRGEEVEAPTISDLLGLPVDANGNSFVDGGDESTLEEWDDSGDGFVSASELIDHLLFIPVQEMLANAGSGDTEDFIDDLLDDLDLTLDGLGGGYSVDFNVVNADTIDLTEEVDSEVSFRLGFELIVSQSMSIDLGLEADELQLHAFTGSAFDPTPPKVDVDATLAFGFEFGVFTAGKADGDLNSDDFFIRSADDLLVSVTVLDPDLDFSLNIGFLGAAVVDGEMDLQADIEGQLNDPNSPSVLGFEGGHYDDLSAQYGVEMGAGVVVANDVLPDWDLEHDAGFFLRIGNIGISTEVLVAADDNDSDADLILDIQSSLVDAGLVELITAEIVGGKIQFSLPSTNAAPLGFDAEAIDSTGSLIAGAAPPSFEPGETVKFLLSVAGAIPQLIAVRFPDAAREDIGFGADQSAGLDPLLASAPPGAGLLNGVGTEANFTLTLSFDDDTEMAVAVNVTEGLALGDPNTTIAHVVADLNVALVNAGVAAFVTADVEAGSIKLVPAASVSALEISGTDATANTDLGFVDGQGSYLNLIADSAIGNVSFSDGIDNTNDDAHFIATVNNLEYDIVVSADNGRTTNAELALAIDAALNSALSGDGFTINVSEAAGGIIELTADDASIFSFSIQAENQDLDDLIDDVNRALTAGGASGVTAVETGGAIEFQSGGGESLELTKTLTFDAGVTGQELDPFDPDSVPDASFIAEPGADSNFDFTLPVHVLAGIHDVDTGLDYDPQNLAIVGNFDPFGSVAGSLDPETLRFALDFEVDPGALAPPADPVEIAIPNPVPVETLGLINFSEVIQFNEIQASNVIGLLSQLGTALDSIMQSGEFASYGLPFTEASLTDIVAFESLIQDALIYRPGLDGEFDEDPGTSDDTDLLLERRELPGVPGPKFGQFPTFATAQELAVKLSELLSLPLFTDVDYASAGGINASYDTVENELTYDINLISSDRVAVGIESEFTAPFAFNVDLTPFSEFEINPVNTGGVEDEDLLVTFEARTVLSTTFGFDLTTDADSDSDTHEDTVEERFFVRDAEFGGAFQAQLPADGVAGAALLGIVGVDVLMEGQLSGQFSAQLQRDVDGVEDDDGTPDPLSQVSLEDIQNDIQNNYRGNQLDGIQVATDPVVERLSELDFEGQAGPDFGNVEEGTRIVSDYGGTAYVFGVEDNGADGTLTLFGVEGSFAYEGEDEDPDPNVFIDVRDIGEADPLSGAIASTAVAVLPDFGALTMDVTVQPGFDAFGFGDDLEAALDGLNGVVDLQLIEFGDPNAGPAILPTVDATVLQDSLDLVGDLADFAELTYTDLIAALEGLGDLIAGLEDSYPILSEVIPIVNRTVGELLGLQEGVDRAIASARLILSQQAELLEPGEVDIPTLDLQSLAVVLRGAFGLADDSDGIVVDVKNDGGTSYLTLDFDIEKTISTTLGMDIALGDNLPNLTSGRLLRVDGDLGWGFKIGINLDDPSDVQLFNPDGGFTGNLDIIGEGAKGVGMVFLAQVGEMPVQVMDALVNIDLSFDLGGLDFVDDKKSLDSVDYSDFIPSISEQSYDVSIPLFDVNGGLTGFLGEIAGSGTSMIDDVINDSFSVLDTGALSTLETLVTDFVGNIEDFNALDNLLLLTDTADFFFEAIQDLIDRATSIDIPIVGDNLSDGTRFIEDFRSTFVAKFRSLVENTNDISTADVTAFFNEFFSSIGLGVIVSEIVDTDDEVRWGLSLSDDYTVKFNLGFELGVPLLAMELDIPLAVGVDWSLDFGLGVNESEGAYVLLNQGGGQELDIDLTVEMPENDLFRGELGFLEVTVDNHGSGMEFEFDLDLSNTSDGTDILGIKDLGNIGLAAAISGGVLPGNAHLLDLGLSIGINGLDGVFPRISTDFIMDWSLGQGIDGPVDIVDNAVEEGLQLIDFRDVGLDLASFLDGFLGDVLGEIAEFTDPLNDIVSFLGEPIPILTQLGEIVGADPVTLLSLAETFGIADTEYVEWILEVLGVIDEITGIGLDSGDEMILPIGELEIYDPDDIDGDLLTGASDLVGELFNIDADIGDVIGDALGGFDDILAEAGEFIGNFADALDGLEPTPGKETETLETVENLTVGPASDLFSFPFLDNPESILGLLVGQDATLVQVDIPPLGVGFDYEQFFTIFGPLGASVGAGFFVGFDLSFGFDTYGLNRYARSDYTNPGLIFDGFFFGDREAGSDGDVTTGVDIPEIFFEFTLTGTAELNLGIARGGVGGGITARLFWDWHDPNNDGALHISELINNIEHAIREADNDAEAVADAILAPFDLGGDLAARFFAFLIIDLGVTELEYFFDIFGPETLLDFEIGFDRSPILATDLENGTLQLNMGPNAIDRLNGSTTDGDEAMVVTYDNGNILVSSPSLGVSGQQTYSGTYDHIVALGGAGNDNIEFIGFDDSNITFNLQGGDGDDVIKFTEDAGNVAPATGAGAVIQGGRGNDTLIGSHLNDTIYGGEGNDMIAGGRGYDILFGDQGDLQAIDSDAWSIGTRVSGLDGNDTIYGGSASVTELKDTDKDDIIIGGGGEDELHGDAGRDIILGDAGRFNFDKENGHIKMSGFDIADFEPNDPLEVIDDPAVSTDTKIQAILTALTDKFSGTDLGGGANDTLFGGEGSDIIFGGAANDIIEGGGGADYVVGGKGFDNIKGNGGNDNLFGNDQDDIIEGNEGRDVISGAFGDDELHGNAGDDFIVGGRGRDIMFGDEDNDELHGQGEPDIMFGGADDDLILGGVGADIMMGDNGLVVKFAAGTSAELVIGKGDSTKKDPYAADADDIGGSLDLILTDVKAADGNDILSGGEGGDLIMGGGGEDLAGGDVDPRYDTANSDSEVTPIGNDFIIGDGGVMQFDERRLQLVASVISPVAAEFSDTLFGDNGDDVIIGGQGADGDDNGTSVDKNVKDNPFLLAGGHGPGRGETDDGASDNDIIIGDNGKLVYVDKTDSANFGKLQYIQTTDTTNATGGADTAYGQLGDDIILGGVNGSIDVLTGSLGEDVILGDNGIIHFDYDWQADNNRDDDSYLPADGDVVSIDLIRSFTDGLGGIDIISGDAGVDTLLGGEAGDIIYGDNSSASAGSDDAGDVILGDNGDLFLQGNAGQLLVQGTAIDYITTRDTAESTGGADTISGNTGADVILGGVNDGGSDIIYGDAVSQDNFDSDDLILGDNGMLLFNYDWTADTPHYANVFTFTDNNRSTLDLVRSFNDGLGGSDTISGDVGGDMILGGNGGDVIHGDNVSADAGALDGDEIILGDNGDVFFNGPAVENARVILASAVQWMTTRDQIESTGGDDLIEGNAGADIILGGVNDGGIDRIYGDARSPVHGFDGDDILLGDNGLVSFDQGDEDLSTLDLIQTIAQNDDATLVLGGEDYIFGNAGSDTALGGSGSDRIIGDNDEEAADDESGNANVLGQGAAADILIGDQGEVERLNNIPTLIQSTDSLEIEGGADHIQGNDGDDVIVGGVVGDELHGEAFLADDLGVAALVAAEGDDIILGDEGRLWFNIADNAFLVALNDAVDAQGDGDPTTLDRVETFFTGVLGGDDEIYGNGGDDLAMGGTGADLIYGDFYKGSLIAALNPGDDTLLGDGGEKTFQLENAIVLRSLSTDQGGSDTIHGNDHNDIVMGGFDGDLLYGESDASHLALQTGRAGDDTLLGDNGRLDWILPEDTILGRQDVFAHQGDSTTVLLDGGSADPATLDRIMTIAPTHGGNDVIFGNGNTNNAAGDLVFGGTGNDTVYGDTDEAAPNGVDGLDGADLIVGDHGKLFPTLPTLDDFYINNHFFSIDTQKEDGADFDVDSGNDFADVLWGNAGADIIIGGQDDDIIFGGTQDDDLIGGHNVSGGDDDLDAMPAADRLAINPGTLADLNPADVNEINDIIDGGADDDVIAGDNAIIIRQLNTDSPRFRMTANGLLYALVNENVGGIADVDVGFVADVTSDFQSHQDMDLVRTVVLLDHTQAIEDAAEQSPTEPRPFGNDVNAGMSEDDEIFAQLGDDIVQGDGLIEVTEDDANFDPYNPSQSADASFDIRDFSAFTDLTTSTSHILRFTVIESVGDGDDYLEGNGGNDRMYGNLGQDDIIGGSSTLFGLGNDNPVNDPDGSLDDHLLRPDGADMIYGGAGNIDLLSRNAYVEGGNTLVPEGERHAHDADTILGDNGDIFRIVEDINPDPEIFELGYASFSYDYDATTADGFLDDGYDGGSLMILPRAVNFADYGYSYEDSGGSREVLTFLDTARGEGDLIYGESGDDVIHGMMGADTIFGNSEHDDIYGEIGSDFLLGGTGIDGIVGDDGLILTSRNDLLPETLNGVAALNEEQVFVKKNDEVDVHALNAVIATPGNIKVAIINIEGELTKAVDLFAFRTDDIDGTAPAPLNEFGEPMRWNDIIFGGLQNDFIHGGDGDDALSGAEALPVYYSGEGKEQGPNQEFTLVNTFLQNMQNSPVHEVPDVADNPFWFDFAPYNPGDVLRFEGKAISDENGQGSRTRDEFAWYDEFNPRRQIMFDFEAGVGAVEALTTLTGVASSIGFILNFDATEGPLGPTFEGDDERLPSDGADRIFGDLGNDWQVGGSGRDHMYGGRGDDLLNMDDNHDSGAGGRVGPHDPEPDQLDNTQSDEFQAYADIVYAGAGRDVMILNTGADRATDWVGEYNSYIVPFSPFGAFHISRTLQPQLPEFLFALSDSDGVDIHVSVDPAVINNTVDAQLFVDQKYEDVRVDDPDAIKNFEPYGELGMVRQTDFDWQQQTGAPNDPQPGNLQGQREIIRRELFSEPETVAFAADVGNFVVANGAMTATPELLGEETISLFNLDQMQPAYMEILVTINAEKDKAGTKSNAYVIFDYQGPEDFKFAGVEVGTDKIQIGHRDASGWVIDSQTQMQLKAGTDYDLTVVLFNSVATVYVNQSQNLSLDFGEALNDGGMIGVGTHNAVAEFDDYQVQQLPPVWTFENQEDFSGGTNEFDQRSGDWQQSGGELVATADGEAPAIATQYMDLAAFSRLELVANVQTGEQGGFVFDYYNENDFKYLTLDAATDQVIIGHYTTHGWSIDATAELNVKDTKSYELSLSLFGTTASVLVDGEAVLAHVFNGLLNDGDFGLLGAEGSTAFDDLLVRGDDPAYNQAPEATYEAAKVGNEQSVATDTADSLQGLMHVPAANAGDLFDTASSEPFGHLSAYANVQPLFTPSAKYYDYGATFNSEHQDVIELQGDGEEWLAYGMNRGELETHGLLTATPGEAQSSKNIWQEVSGTEALNLPDRMVAW